MTGKKTDGDVLRLATATPDTINGVRAGRNGPRVRHVHGYTRRFLTRKWRTLQKLDQRTRNRPERVRLQLKQTTQPALFRASLFQEFCCVSLKKRRKNIGKGPFQRTAGDTDGSYCLRVTWYWGGGGLYIRCLNLLAPTSTSCNATGGEGLFSPTAKQIAS